MIAFLYGLPIGSFFGLLYGPLRLAGVDFGKWYRDPAEINEGDDRSWIGLLKRTTFSAANWLLAGALGLFFSSAGPPRYWSLAFFLGVLLGIVVAQVSLEIAWRLGLLGTGREIHIQLSHAPAASITLPQTPGRRRLVVCCDGTWNSPEQKRETNVVQLLRAIQPVALIGSDSVTQISYYHLGVGTGNALDRLLGGGTGVGLSSSVKSCYGFLVDNYQPGDEILLFGFSRGAYVVRSVAGLIGLVGLLHKKEMFRFDDLWDYYTLPVKDRVHYNLSSIAPLRCTDIGISCVGVWDTVGALGIPGTRLCASAYTFHQTSLGAHVYHAFQALAMDERRGNFQPAIWVRQTTTQVLEQVWFPGVHSNVGGGYLKHGLSDATLAWMIDRLRTYKLLDVDLDSIGSAISRAHAERYARGDLNDSRSFFWKMIAVPIPRPVGITDPSERIHESAPDRSRLRMKRDVYSTSSRIAWLGTIAPAKIATRTPLQMRLSFQGTPPGHLYSRVVPPKRGACAWLLRTLLGPT